MLGLEDPFARRKGRGARDSVRVHELVEVTRRSLLAAERNAAAVKWHVPPGRADWADKGGRRGGGGGGGGGGGLGSSRGRSSIARDVL